MRRKREEILRIDARQDGDEEADVQRKGLRARNLWAEGDMGRGLIDDTTREEARGM